MYRLKDIMTTDVVTVHTDMTLREVAELFAARHISGAPVVTAERVVGVITASDLVSIAADMADEPGVDQAGDEGPDGASECASTDDVADTWLNDQSEAVAFLEAAPQPAAATFGSSRVSDVMTRIVYALPPDAGWQAAGDLMRRHQVHRVLVMDGDHLLGVVSAMDIARTVAEGHVTAHTYVFDRTSDGPLHEGSRSSLRRSRR